MSFIIFSLLIIIALVSMFLEKKCWNLLPMGRYYRLKFIKCHLGNTMWQIKKHENSHNVTTKKQKNYLLRRSQLLRFEVAQSFVFGHRLKYQNQTQFKFLIKYDSRD